jgi:hypothetical protein
MDRGIGGTHKHEVPTREAALPVQAVKSTDAGARERGHLGQVDHDPGDPGRTEPVVEDAGQFAVDRVVECPAHAQQQGAGSRLLELDRRLRAVIA